MRIAVAGATGRVGRLTMDVLERAGHQTVPVSRGSGADACTGAGLDDALRGAGAVIDATNVPGSDEAKIVDFFGTTTRNLLAAGERAGVRHHVLLSVVGIDRGQQVAHYAGKREQERLVRPRIASAVRGMLQPAAGSGPAPREGARGRARGFRSLAAAAGTHSARSGAAGPGLIMRLLTLRNCWLT